MFFDLLRSNGRRSCIGNTLQCFIQKVIKVICAKNYAFRMNVKQSFNSKKKFNLNSFEFEWMNFLHVKLSTCTQSQNVFTYN